MARQVILWGDNPKQETIALNAELSKVLDVITEISATAKNITIPELKSVTTITDATGAITKMSTEIKRLGEATEAVTGIIDKFQDSLAENVKQQVLIGDKINQQSNSIRVLSMQYEEYKKKLGENNVVSKELQKQIDNTSRSLADNTTKLKTLRGEMDAMIGTTENLAKTKVKLIAADTEEYKTKLLLEEQLKRRNAQLKEQVANEIGLSEKQIAAQNKLLEAANERERKEVLAFTEAQNKKAIAAEEAAKRIENANTLANRKMANDIAVQGLKDEQSFYGGRANRTVDPNSLSGIRAEMLRLKEAGHEASDEFKILAEREAELASVSTKLKTETNAASGAFDKIGQFIIRDIYRFAAGMITFTAFALVWEKLVDIWKDAQDPLAKINDELDKEIELLGRRQQMLDKVSQVRELEDPALKQFNNGQYENEQNNLQIDLTIAQSKVKTGKLSKSEVEEQKKVQEDIIRIQKDMLQSKINYNKWRINAIDQSGKDVVWSDSDPMNLMPNTKNGDDNKNKKLIDELNRQNALYMAQQNALDNENKNKKYSLSTKDYQYAADKDYIQAHKKNIDERIKLEIDKNKIIIDNEKSTLEEKTNAAKANFALGLQMMRADIRAQQDLLFKANTELRRKIGLTDNPTQKGELAEQIQGNNQKIEALSVQSHRQELDLTRSSEKEVTQIMVDEVRKRLDALKSIEENSNIGKDSLLMGLYNRFKKRGGSQAKFDRQKERIVDDAAVSKRSQQQAYLQEQLSDGGLSGFSKVGIVQEMAKINQEGQDAEAKKAEDEAKRKIEAQKAIKDATINFAEEAASALKTIRDNQFEQEQMMLQWKLQALQLQTQEEINAVNAGPGFAIEKQKQLAQINAQSQAQQNQIAAQQRQLAIEKAKFDKASAEASIIEKTAVAIMEVWAEDAWDTPVAVALTGLIAATGAAQLAAASSAPVPQFAVGTDSAPRGLAIVGERGSEAVIGRDGTIGFTPDKPTLTYLQGGEKIIPHDETKRMFEQAKTLANSAYYHMDANGQPVIDVNMLMWNDNENSKKVVEAIRKINKQPQSAPSPYSVDAFNYMLLKGK